MNHSHFFTLTLVLLVAPLASQGVLIETIHGEGYNHVEACNGANCISDHDPYMFVLSPPTFDSGGAFASVNGTLAACGEHFTATSSSFDFYYSARVEVSDTPGAHASADVILNIVLYIGEPSLYEGTIGSGVWQPGSYKFSLGGTLALFTPGAEQMSGEWHLRLTPFSVPDAGGSASFTVLGLMAVLIIGRLFKAPAPFARNARAPTKGPNVV